MSELDDEVPHIEVPDELDDDHERNGLVCFMNMDRQCGADCMAYTTHPSESKYLNDQQGHCVAIVGVERLGRYVGGVLSLLSKKNADDARSRVQPPPSPTGGA
jgi:hypothetical protein